MNSLQEFTDLGIDFVSLKDQIDMTTSTGRLMTHIIGAFAQFEADIIKTRVKSGLANAKAKGIRLGRPSQIDIYEVRRLRGEGFSLGQIAKRLKVTKSGVSKILTRTGDPKKLTNMDIAELIRIVRKGDKTEVKETG